MIITPDMRTHFVFVLIVGLALQLGSAQNQDPKCLLPVEPGPCRMNLERFYYNAKTNSCEKFKFGGCRGNDNKFGFLETCQEACSKSNTS